MTPQLQFIVKTTGELTADDRSGMISLFTRVFNRRFPADLYDRKYARSCLGESLHCLALADGTVVGSCSAIPVRYSFFAQTRLFAAIVDLMLAPEYRGPLKHVVTMTGKLFAATAARDCAFIFSCVRDEMRLFHEAVSRWRVIGQVRYYVAPVGARGAAALRLAVGAWNAFCPRRTVAWQPEIEKINDAAFAAWRYGMFPVSYRRMELGRGAKCVYTTELFYPIEGLPASLRMGILLDVNPPEKANIEAAVDAIQRRERDIDFLAYQGYLPFQPRNLLRVPARFERKAWFLMGRILRGELVDNRIFDIAKWNINLSNGDLI